MKRIAWWLETVLKIFSGFLMIALTAVVVYAVLWRYLGGASPRWYDEVASIMLVWLTYYAGALAALQRGHIAVQGVLMSMPPKWRMAGAILAEVFVIGFFIVLTWTGMVLVDVVQGMSLVSVTAIPLQFTQSVIPIGAVLFIVAQLLSLPEHLERVRAGKTMDEKELEEAVAEAEAAAEFLAGPGRENATDQAARERVTQKRGQQT